MLWVYGDSFSSTEVDRCPGWAQLLADKVGHELCSKAVSGSSTEYAAQQFQIDVREDVLADDDIVIFQTSTSGRVHLQFQKDRPETASVYASTLFDDNGESRHVWYRENKKHIEWYLRNYDTTVMSIFQEAVVNSVRNYAETKPNTVFVILQNTRSTPEFQIPRGKDPDNFLFVNVELSQVSHNEFKKPYNYVDWRSWTKYDARINHLSNTNLEILSDLIRKSIADRNTDAITYDKFVQHIFEPINSVEDYVRYCEQNYLYYRPWFIKD
jgi:hypothetical protein